MLLCTNKLLQMFVIFIIMSSNANAHMFSFEEEPTKWEIISKLIMEGIVFVRDFSFQLVKWMIYKRTMETLVTTLLIVIVILIQMLLKRGRHSSQKSNSTATTNVNLFNTVQLDAQDQSNVAGIIYPNVMHINKIHVLKRNNELSKLDCNGGILSKR